MGNTPTSSADKQISSADRHHMSETSSRCFAECTTATHNFEVIRVCPDGWDEHSAGNLSVGLRFCSGTTDAKVKYSLSLLEKDGKVSNLHSDVHTFKTVGDARGWKNFIDKSKLQQLLSFNDDCFTIRCVLTVVKEPHMEDVSTIIQLPQSDLQRHFANMLKDGEGADVTFNVGGQLISAHRYVLAARSPVFKAELFGQMKETTMQCIKIDDMEPAIFEALLHFIYTESLPSNPELDQDAALQHMLVAADRYGLGRLKAICEGKLCLRINVQTVATTLVLAEQHHSVQLKNACLGYLSSQNVLRVVKETDGFKHLTASCPSIMMDILDKFMPPSGV